MCECVSSALLQAKNSGSSSYLLYRQLLQFGQRAGEQSHQEGGRAAHDVNHGWGQHRDEGVLPGEGVQQGHHSVRAAREGAGERGTTMLAQLVLHPRHLPPLVNSAWENASGQGAAQFPGVPFNVSLLTSDCLCPLLVHTISLLCGVVAPLVPTSRWLETKGKKTRINLFYYSSQETLWSRRWGFMFPTIPNSNHFEWCLKSKSNFCS